MPRQARLELPGIPMHVTQRGVNRCAIFLDDEDCQHYRRLLREACRKHEVAVHAFVLMDNHVHLLLWASQVGRIAPAMRAVGQAHVQAFNFRHGRSGALWQGRFKSCLVDTDRYLLTVIRYIELNPVRAAMVARPEDYRWSSVHTPLARLATRCSPCIRSTCRLEQIPCSGQKPMVPGYGLASARTNLQMSGATWPRSARWEITLPADGRAGVEQASNLSASWRPRKQGDKGG